MEYNSNFKYDLKIGQKGEKKLAEILENKTIEVKTDLRAKETGNVYVEYKSRGKLSGLATTEADYYCFIIEDNLHLIETNKLKDLCRKYRHTKRDTWGGDDDTSKGILLPINELL